MRGDFLQKNKGAITLIILALLLWWGYTTFFNSESDIDTMQTELVGKEVIDTLHRLEQIRLDASLFSSPEFRNLEEFNLVIPEQARGRINPFAPVR